MDDERELTAQELLAAYGQQLSGEAWILMVELSEPLEEVALAAGLEPQIYFASSGHPTGLSQLLIETPYGYVLRLAVTLFDRPTAPYELRLPLNPAADAAAPMLSRLASQETIQILLFDERSGDPLGRRLLRLDPDFRASLADIVRLAAARPSTPALWMQAVAAASAHL